MLELTVANAIDYLRDHGQIGPGPAQVEALSGGVSNLVLRVETADRLFILKQSRQQLRTRDAWFSDLERVYREQEVMQVLQPLLPPLTVPEVLFSDRSNFVFTMSHAPRAAQVWKQQLLAGQIDPAMGRLAGAILGRIHEATANDMGLAERFGDRAVFVQLRVSPYYRCIQQRIPDVADAITPLIEGMTALNQALCHGDFSPKNILVHEQGFTLVDYETAHFGDPTMDLGFFLSHLVLKVLKRWEDRRRHLDLVRSFWNSYAAEVTFRPLAELEARGLGHLGVCLLARIDGTSPVDYLSEPPKREAARRLGKRLLLERPTRLVEMLEMTQQCMPA
jgi:5-methylthioribose kinase